MQTITPLAGSPQKSDPQIVKQWAAEDFAIAIGLLRECPYHGQPFKAARNPLTRKALSASIMNPLDPNLRVFNGNTGELLAAVERVTRTYGERCPECAQLDHEDFE
jgi:hypothetical protein